MSEGTEIEKSAAERALEDVLQATGFAIVSEDPEYRSGSTSYYRIEAKRIPTSDDEKPVVGQGVTRLDALKGVLVMSHAQ